MVEVYKKNSIANILCIIPYSILINAIDSNNNPDNLYLSFPTKNPKDIIIRNPNKYHLASVKWYVENESTNPLPIKYNNNGKIIPNKAEINTITTLDLFNKFNFLHRVFNGCIYKYINTI